MSWPGHLSGWVPSAHPTVSCGRSVRTAGTVLHPPPRPISEQGRAWPLWPVGLPLSQRGEWASVGLLLLLGGGTHSRGLLLLGAETRIAPQDSIPSRGVQAAFHRVALCPTAPRLYSCASQENVQKQSPETVSSPGWKAPQHGFVFITFYHLIQK